MRSLGKKGDTPHINREENKAFSVQFEQGNLTPPSQIVDGSISIGLSSSKCKSKQSRALNKKTNEIVYGNFISNYQ